MQVSQELVTVQSVTHLKLVIQMQKKQRFIGHGTSSLWLPILSGASGKEITLRQSQMTEDEDI